MSKIVKLAATAVALALAASAAAQSQSQSQSSDAKKNESDYRSLQYGNGQLTPEQNANVKRRADTLNQVMSDDGTTRPSPTPTRRRGTARPQ